MDEFGKMPPQAIDFEEFVLGAILIEPMAINDICDIIIPESFYKDNNAKIYQACLELLKDNKPIDIITVPEQLRKNGFIDEVGGIAYITQLTNRVSSSLHVVYHAKIIQQKNIQRELIMVSNEINKRAYDDSVDIHDLINYAETSLLNIQENNINKEAIKISDIGRGEIDLMIKLSKSKVEFTGIPSGFVTLDRVTSGWQNTDLIILAGRPSMGKTAFVLSIAKNMCIEFGKKVGIFSLEMGTEQLWRRLISGLSGIENGRLRNANFQEHEWIKVDSAQSKLETCNMYVDDTPGLNIIELRAKARRMKMKYGIEIFIIDYLQLMSGVNKNNGNREQEISSITRTLKIMAKDLNIPVICLSQLNRSVEIRGGDKRPQLSDLRESGAIEQDADIVGFIHRPEYYGINFYENGESTANIVEILIKKHRNGALAEVLLKRNQSFSDIYEIDEKYDIDDIF